MKTTLMNKNVPLLEMDVDHKTGYIKEIIKLHNLEYMPLGIYDEEGKPSVAKLHKWWSSRSIPASRDGIKEVLSNLGLETPQELIYKSFGLSLSDQYWIKPVQTELEWKHINFFDNDFSRDVGEAFFKEVKGNLDLMSPDNTSDGWLKKKWIIEDGNRLLLKSGSKPFLQEPFNEVIATKILEQTKGVSYVSYEVYREEPLYLSKCKNFITSSTEFIPAHYVYNAIKKSEKDTPYEHLRKCAEQFGITGYQSFLNHMLTLDYLILNTDRHWGNFGFIRNVDTLKFEGPAPLFDHGTSLWNNELKVIPHYEPSKPFRSTQSKQIKLVEDFQAFPLNKIKNLEPLIANTFVQNVNLDEKRIEMLCKGIKDRIENLERAIEK